MAQTATQRLMAVAIELEDERFTERRRFEQLHEDVSQRLTSMRVATRSMWPYAGLGLG